ncbi:hypothetical protein RDI58_022451 [Solanum bulbocastanum]|uniref:Uncharacterized protein n=1 Tax=Solanum bulbocastanum TaxID=147425 RepID=A0AAN8Y5S7_SOLBU
MASTTINVTDAKKCTIEHLSSGEKEYPSMENKFGTLCGGAGNSHFLHSFVAATECRVLQAFDAAMWMPYVPVLLWKLKIFSPVIAGDFDQRWSRRSKHERCICFV